MEVVPCRDAALFTNIMMDAYEPLPSTEFIFPKGVTPQLRQTLTDLVKSQMDELGGTTWVQAVDPSSGDILGVSKWSTDYKPASAQLAEQAKLEKEVVEQAAEETTHKAPSDSQTNASQDGAYINTALFAASTEQKSKIIRNVFGDSKFLHLATLAVAPKHQRNGAGKKLLCTCLEYADREGLDAFLEASPWAEALYARNGFEIVGQTEYDTGKGEMYTQNVMVRKHR